MSTPRLTYDVPIKPEYGYFYGLSISRGEDYDFVTGRQNADWIIGDDESLEDYGSNADIRKRKKKRVTVRQCSLNKEHCQAEVPYAFELDFYNKALTPGFIPLSDNYCVLNNDLKQRLEKSGLTGAEFDPVRKTTWQGEPFQYLQPLFLIEFRGMAQFLMEKIDPPEANRCPFCGHAPLICPECSIGKRFCAKCGKRWVATPKTYQGKGDPRIFTDPNDGPFVALESWDGSDFIFDGIVTRRTVDFLSSIHAAPFKAEPLPVNVHGLSDKDRERLETARAMTKLNW